MAQKYTGSPLTTLSHHLDLLWMREAYGRVRRDSAPGVDGQTVAEYGENLDVNLRSLLERAKNGSYRAPPVKRVHIPKSETETRPIGMPTVESKVLERAVVMLLEPVYEREFLDCSFGFRPGRSAHQALEAVRKAVMATDGGWVLDVDVRKYFDTIPHQKLREVLSLRIRDGVIGRLVGKWLKAGIWEAGQVTYPEAGTPQGGVISPLLSNIYLHEVLDGWFHTTVKPGLHGRAELIRFADDFVVICERREDAEALLAQQHCELSAMVRGHYAYYGIRGNHRALASFREEAKGLWHYWLSRRSRERNGAERLWRLLTEHLRLTTRCATSHHCVDAPGFRGLFHEPHRDVELQVLEFLEVDATAAGLHLAELRGIPLGEVAVLVAGTDVEAVVVFPGGESD